MSVSALVKGVEARLRSVLAADEKTVGVQPAPGRPPAKMGQLYYAVHWAGGRGADKDPQSSDVLHGVTVTLTARLGYAPQDRRGKVITDALGLYDLVDQLAGPGLIHGAWEVVTAANALISGAGTTVNGFCETLVLLDYGPEREEGPDWIGSKAEPEVYAVDVRFGDARRFQRIF